MNEDAGWHTLCVSYYDEHAQSDLLLDAVRPLFAEVSGEVAAAYFVRHWRRGPHLRLNFRTTGERMREVVRPAVDRRVGAFLRDHPSTSAVDPESLLPTYRRLAEIEQEDGPLWPPRPDNHVCTEPYDSRAHVLGGQEASELFADFYTTANAAAFAALDAVRCGEQRLWAGFALMAATAHVFSGRGVTAGFVSLRAHAEIHLARSTVQQRERAAWDRLYRDARPALCARLTRAVSAWEETPYLRAWIDALRAVEERGFAMVDSDGVDMNQRILPSRGTTAFLQELIADEDFRTRMKPSAPFRHYRLVVNLLYLQLTRLGIRASERHLLGHLLANTVEDLQGVDAMTLIRKYSAEVPRPS